MSLEGYNKVMQKFFEWREEHKNYYGVYPQRIIEEDWDKEEK